jgi:hypothetical protein
MNSRYCDRMDRISSRTLRLVIIGLAGCAAVGVWMGLSDSLRRIAPEWEGGQARATVPLVPGPPDAVAFTPGPGDRAIQKALPAPTELAEQKPAEAKTAATTPTSQTPQPASPAPTVARPVANDPIGDLVQEKTAAPPPPEVPF